MGRVIGASEVKVIKTKVEIKRLHVDVITGLDLKIDSDAALPGTMVAHLARGSKLTKKYQV